MIYLPAPANNEPRYYATGVKAVCDVLGIPLLTDGRRYIGDNVILKTLFDGQYAEVYAQRYTRADGTTLHMYPLLKYGFGEPLAPGVGTVHYVPDAPQWEEVNSAILHAQFKYLFANDRGKVLYDARGR